MSITFKQIQTFPRPWACNVDPIHKLVYHFEAVLAFKEEMARREENQPSAIALQKLWKNYWCERPDDHYEMTALVIDQLKRESIQDKIDTEIIEAFAKACIKVTDPQHPPHFAYCVASTGVQKALNSKNKKLIVMRLTKRLEIDASTSAFKSIINYWKSLLAHSGIRFITWGSAKTGLEQLPPENTRKKKVSMSRGDAKELILAKLREHHQYDGDSCQNFQPIGNNELASSLTIAGSTVSEFFKKNFKSHKNYMRMCQNTGQLVAALQILCREVYPYMLLGDNANRIAAPPEETL